jgi:serpin B
VKRRCGPLGIAADVGPIRGVLNLLVAAVLVVGCTGGLSPSSAATTAPTSPRPSWQAGIGFAISAVARVAADPAGASLAAEGINDFGLELFRMGTPDAENAVLSPTSIAIALAMARAGARTETATEMDQVLRSVASDENASWLNALDAALAQRTGTFRDSRGEDAAIVLRIVNAPFTQADYAWQPDYLDDLASRFGAGIRLVDYVNDAEAARIAINGWVGDQTEQRIPELLERGIVDHLTRVVLVNAIYLKAAWRTPFSKDATSPAPFHRLDGSTITVPTMRGTAGSRYAEGEGWQAVEIPYVGDQLAMMIVQPDDLATFEESLDGAAFSAIVAALEDVRVLVSMPRFGIESSLALNGVLAEMGMPTAFDEHADFSGMTLAEQLYIKAVVHQANIDVDEAGTEASAATAVIVGTVSMPRSVAIDRPFLFALRDVSTGAILFLGRVVEPVERS